MASCEMCHSSCVIPGPASNAIEGPVIVLSKVWQLEFRENLCYYLGLKTLALTHLSRVVSSKLSYDLTLKSGIDVPPDYLFFAKMHTRSFLLQPPAY